MGHSKEACFDSPRPCVIARSPVSCDDIAAVLRDLGDGCAHTWTRYARAGLAPEALLEHERQLRDTTFFAYSLAEKPDEVVAIATVADRIHHRFGHAGFPVLARCFVRPAFRGMGLYRAVLDHRVRFCEDQLGGALKALHIGTADRCVERVVSQYGFVRVGEEQLEPGVRVGAFVRFVPAFRNSLWNAVERRRSPRRVAPAGGRVGNAVARMQRLVRRMTMRGLEPGAHLLLERAIGEIGQLTDWRPASHPELASVLDFFHSIPLADGAASAGEGTQ